MRPILGIDPGVRGGIAILNPDGTVERAQGFTPGVEEVVFASSLRGTVEILRDLGGWICYVEQVGYMPGDGGRGAFTFGKVYGMILASVMQDGIVVRRVRPMIWQSKLNCLSGGNKNVTKNLAQGLFPGIKVTHAIADALLIARYGQIMEAAALPNRGAEAPGAM